MSAMNAMGGRSMGGAFGAGAAQTAIGGMQARQQTRADWQKEGLELRMGYLDRLYQDAVREDNQEQQREIQRMMDQSQQEHDQLAYAEPAKIIIQEG